MNTSKCTVPSIKCRRIEVYKKAANKTSDLTPGHSSTNGVPSRHV